MDLLDELVLCEQKSKVPLSRIPRCGLKNGAPPACQQPSFSDTSDRLRDWGLSLLTGLCSPDARIDAFAIDPVAEMERRRVKSL